MRIVDYRPADFEEQGLAPCSFRGLGRVVVLAGPNGGGKSRLLTQVLRDVGKANRFAQEIANHQRTIEGLEGVREIAPGTTRPHQEALEGAIRNLSRLMVVDGELGETPLMLRFPGNLSMVGHERYPLADLQNAEAEASRRELHQCYSEAGKFLGYCAQVLSYAKHPDSSGIPEFAQKLQLVQAFSGLLHELAGTQVTYSPATGIPQPVLFGRVFKPDELSAGQRRLVAWALHLHSKMEGGLEGSIVLLDEPETELHPAACIEILSRLERAVGEQGQVWVATHSPAVVARFLGEGSVYFVQNGQTEYATSNPEIVMAGLLGGEQARDGFRDFLASSEQVALLAYAAKSLEPPEIAGHSEGDVQEREFATDMANARPESGGPLRVLDYGAGRSRFAAALATLESSPDFQYFAFNDAAHNRHRDEAIANIRKLHQGDAEARIETSISAFRGEENQCDRVVMCNFLHEVPIDEWLGHFKNAHDVLRDGGKLLLIEDQEPPVGELPNDSGFLILNLDEVRRVFGTRGVQAIDVGRDRLTSIEVSKDVLLNANMESIRAAVRDVRVRALKLLKELRRSDPTSPRRGRRHALYAMLYANSSLAVPE